MHLNNLNGFRAGLYDTFRRWSDALFETCDATLCATAPVTSLPMLSLEPVSRRSHGSLYRSLAEGEIDTEAFNDLLMAHRPTDWPDVFAVDASTWARCDAETSPQRGFYYSASKHSAGQPIVAGWSYEWTCQLNWEPNSWTAPIDVGRIDPNTNALDQTITRIRRLTERLDCDNPTFVLDAGYDPIALTHHLADTNAHIVVRIRSDRVFYNNPPAPEPHTKGRPRRHGTRHECANPDTWPEPDRTHTTHDNRYGTITINAWDGLHPKLGRKKGSRWADFDQPPIIAGTVISVSVDHLPKNVVALGNKPPPGRHRPRSPRLPPPLRHRTHLPVHQEHPRMDHTLGLHTRTSRPVDPNDRRRLHPTPARQTPRRGPPAPLGETPTTQQTHPSQNQTRLSASPPRTHQPSQTTKKPNTRTRTPQRHPNRPPTPTPTHQTSSLNPISRFKRKLRNPKNFVGSS